MTPAQRPEPGVPGRASLPTTDVTDLPPLARPAKAAGWGLASWGGVQLAASLLARSETATLLAQAAVAQWGAGQIGISWIDRRATASAWRSVASRVARGAALGALAAGSVVALALAAGGAVATPAPPAMEGILEAGILGLVVAGLAAARDELILRGVVLRVTGPLLPEWVGLLACGGAAAAARFGLDGTVTLALVSEGFRAIALAAAWTHDRGPWMAWGANTAWTWALGSLAWGGFFDPRLVGDPGASRAAVVVCGAAALGASVALALRTMSRGVRE